MDLVGRSPRSPTSPPPHYYPPLTSPVLYLLLPSTPHSYPSTTIPAPNPHSFLPTSYSPSVTTYLPVREERERDRERARVDEGGSPPTTLSSRWMHCTDLTHTQHTCLSYLLCSTAAYRPPPTLPQFSFAPGESSDVYSASSAGELTGGTLSVDSESSRFFPFLSDLEFHTKPRTCANGNCRTH
jgi:hypothetical protein